MAGSTGRKCCLGGTSSCCILAAVVFCAVAIIAVLLYPAFMRNEIRKKLTIEKGHPTYEQLENTTLPIWKDIHFFNLTNPEEFQNGSKPVFDEIGPYSYREYRTKQFLNTSSDDKRISYNQTRVFYFDESTSQAGVAENDTICTINLPLVAAVAEVEGLPNDTKSTAILVLKYIFQNVSAELVMCVGATELAWNFTTPLVTALHTNAVLVAVGLNYPRSYVSIQQNNSINDTKLSTIYTGVGDINRVGRFVQWDGLTSLGVWPGDTANDINGTEGLFFQPLLEKDDRLEAFVQDIVRSVPLHYNTTVDHMGLTAYRYKLPLSVFMSAFTNPENARWGSWCPNGLFYLGVIQYPTVPVFGSNPHFLYGDPILREKVEGVPQANASTDETIVDVERITGANIGVKQQLQINVQVNQTSEFDQLANVNGTLYFPMFYVNEHAELTSDFKHFLQKNGLDLLELANKLIWVVTGVLLFLAFVSMVIFLVTGTMFVRTTRAMNCGKGAYELEETRPLLTK